MRLFGLSASGVAAGMTALLFAMPVASAQTQKKLGPDDPRDIYVTVWLPDGTASTSSVASVTLPDGTAIKSEPITGFHFFAGLGAKTVLLVEEPTVGSGRYELALPELPSVVVDVFFHAPGESEVWMDGTPFEQSSSPGFAGPPANDDCSNAIGIAVPSSTMGTTAGATIDATAPFCNTSVTAPGVWYTLTGTGTTITVTTCSVPFIYDTKISVYCGGCSVLQCVGGNDDNCSGGGSVLQSTVTFCSEAGADYQILVHGFSSGTGAFTLDVSEDGVPCTPTTNCSSPPPSNDDCGSAIPVAVPSSTAGTTTNATVDTTPSCGTSINSPGVWYTVTGTGNSMTATTCVGPFIYDTKITVYCGDCTAPICVTDNDDNCPATFLQSTVTWCSNAGIDYLILVHGFGGQSGDFTLDISDDGTPCGGNATCPSVPANDDCEDAIPVAVPSSTAGTTSLATIDSGFPFCGTGITSPGVWYTVVGTGTSITATTCSVPFFYDSKISVYCGGCDGAICIVGNDDNCSGGGSVLQSTVTWCSGLGVEYLVLVHGFGGASGDFTLDITEDGVPCTPSTVCPGASPFNPTCFGDGSGAPCGCGNESAPGSGAGCINTAGVGAVLTASGVPSVSNDSMSLTADGVVNQPGLFFQGDNSINGGAGATFGDGVRCCGQNVVRIEVVNPPGTMSPATAQMTETATTNGPAGTISPGDVLCYQYWYRDPAGGGVCGSTFNLSNAVETTWEP